MNSKVELVEGEKVVVMTVTENGVAHKIQFDSSKPLTSERLNAAFASAGVGVRAVSEDELRQQDAKRRAASRQAKKEKRAELTRIRHARMWARSSRTILHAETIIRALELLEDVVRERAVFF